MENALEGLFISASVILFVLGLTFSLSMFDRVDDLDEHLKRNIKLKEDVIIVTDDAYYARED